MDFGGHYLLFATRNEVWRALNYPLMLKAAIPGCQAIDWTGAQTLTVRIKVNLGVMQPVFTGDLALSDIIPAERYRLSGRGRGGVLGLAHAAADIVLYDHREGTELSFIAQGQASGTILRLGKGVIGQSAQRVIDGFFIRFAEAMGIDIKTLAPPSGGGG